MHWETGTPTSPRPSDSPEAETSTKPGEPGASSEMAASVAQPNHMSGRLMATTSSHRPSPLRQAQTPRSEQPENPQSHFDDSSASRKLQLNDFMRIRTLGTGTFARVCLVRLAHPKNEAEEERVFALKILRKTQVIRLKQIDHVRNERAVLQDVSGFPFITNLLASFSDHSFLYLLLDYVPGGELFSYLRKYRRFDENTARFYAAEIVLVLEYLHEEQNGIAYRDLKPENLLLDEEGHIKLVDFGFAKRLGGGKKGEGEKEKETYTLCGTPEYLAPEVIQNKGHTTAVDWWALGILIYEFLTGYPPFWDQNPINIYKQIIESPVRFPSSPTISPEAQSLIRALCTADRSHRLGNMAGGSAQVKSHPFFRGINWEDTLHKKHRGPIIPPIRYAGDASCFEFYPEEDTSKEEYTEEMRGKYDGYFEDF